MNPFYTDLHIHTSEDSNKINSDYNVDLLVKNVKKFSNSSNILLSLTDHNRINITAYKKLAQLSEFLVGVELHVRNVTDCPPYHCHVYFDIKNDNLEDELETINQGLLQLYPNAMPNKNDVIPSLFDIVNTFNDYDLLILPHGGQSHSTFDQSIPKDMIFNTTMEKTIYYNLFDGFTSRSNIGLERTISYFERLGISEFINLITCSDNYNVQKYPEDKNSSDNFVPTWIYAKPTFNGLRISLSERTRLYYGENPPHHYHEYISEVYLNHPKININAKLSPGLNVVIGNSSSGKTLLVDSIHKKISANFDKSVYNETFNVSSIKVKNDSNVVPHYFNQNYILDMTKVDSDGLENIDILKNAFPQKEEVIKQSEINIFEMEKDVKILIDSVEKIEDIQKNIRTIPSFVRLITQGKISKNILDIFKVTDSQKIKLTYSDTDFNSDKKVLDQLIERQKSIEFFDNIDNEIQSIKNKIIKSKNMIKFENNIRNIIQESITNKNKEIFEGKKDSKLKEQSKERLFEYISEYRKKLDTFYSILNKIASKYNYSIKTTEIDSLGHKLYIENNFKLTKEIVLEAINKIKTSAEKINNFKEIIPSSLFIDKYRKQSPKIETYDDVKSKIIEFISRTNKVIYKIKYKGIKDFRELSPGLKTSVILDLILGHHTDNAPIIIDQPEDNLATNYLNHDLISALKNIKTERQIIVVTHNATIPMLADAQKIILCTNEDNVINISSHFLEGKINGVNITDKIAELTDGGKASIKKRFKKYNLKNYQSEEQNETINN